MKIIIAALMIASIACLMLAPGCGKPARAEKLSLGVYPSEMSAPIFIAAARGYFADNGLDVFTKRYDSGVTAVKGLLDGEVDVATTAEFVFASDSFDHQDLRVLASIDEVDTIQFVARKDRGITGIMDLRGKKVAVTPGSQAEYFLAKSLDDVDFSLADIQRVDLDPELLQEAIAGGAVDAVVTWEPIVHTIKDRLRANGVTWSAQSGRRFYWTLIATDRLTRERADVVDRLLRSVVAADRFANENETASKEIVVKATNLEPAYLDYVWPKHIFAVSLDQVMLVAMEEEARWHVSTRPTGATAIPDYLERIYFKGLEAIDPSAIGIVHPGEK